MRAGPVVVLIAITGLWLAGVAWQRREARELRAAIERQRAGLAERSRLEAENKRLAAAQPSDEEMEALVAKLAMAEQLRAQLASLRQREEAAARVPAPTAATPAPSLLGNSIGFDHWRNVGQASPDAAFQSALWASANGDLDALAGLLTFNEAAREEAAALFARLPPAMRNEVTTPERLVALLTAMDVPRGRAGIVGQFSSAGGTRVSAQLIDAEGKAKVAVFTLQRDGDRWRLAVPPAVVKKYAGWLDTSPLEK
jgi:hypothetical protein